VLATEYGGGVVWQKEGGDLQEVGAGVDGIAGTGGTGRAQSGEAAWDVVDAVMSALAHEALDAPVQAEAPVMDEEV
jgi:hypothetical protein